MEENTTYSWSPKGSKPPKKNNAPDLSKLSKLMPVMFLVLALH